MAEWSKTLVQIQLAISPLQTQVTVCTRYYPMVLPKWLPAMTSWDGLEICLPLYQFCAGASTIKDFFWLNSSREGNFNKTVLSPGYVRNPGKTACSFSIPEHSSYWEPGYAYSFVILPYQKIYSFKTKLTQWIKSLTLNRLPSFIWELHKGLGNWRTECSQYLIHNKRRAEI